MLYESESPRPADCSVAGCDRPRVARALCNAHYIRQRKFGDVNANKMPTRGLPVAERFALYVDRTDGCWLWTSTIDKDGYGDFWYQGHSRGAHVVALLLDGRELPSGMTVDHLCHDPATCAGGASCLHRRCVRPDHLGLAASSDNVLRGASPTGINSRKTECPQGHPYDEANTRVRPDGARECRECARTRNREAARERRRRRAEAASQT